MTLLLNVIDRITVFLAYLAAVAVVVMMMHVTADVVMENLFGRPLPGTLVIVSNYYMPLVTFLPLAFVERLDRHVKVDVVTQHVPPVAQKHLYGWIYVICFLMTALLAYATWDEAVSKYQIGSFALERGLAIPTWPIRFAAPLAYGLIAALFAFKFLAYVLGSDILRRRTGGLGALGQLDGSDK